MNKGHKVKVQRMMCQRSVLSSVHLFMLFSVFCRAVELCLTEVKKCEFFIGILGDRYGYVPDSYNVPDMEEFDWLKTYPPKASVTELEMHLGALSNPSKFLDKAFFYVRDSSFEK